MKPKKLLFTVLSAILLGAGAPPAFAQVAGTTMIGVAIAEISTVARGWSAKKQILGHTVYNEKNEKVGTIEDIIIAPDKAVSYAIVGAGGFAGLGKHDVAIPVSQFKEDKDRFVLEGASEEMIKGMPKFEYAESR